MHALRKTFPARRLHVDFRGAVLRLQRALAVRLVLDGRRRLQLPARRSHLLRARRLATADQEGAREQGNLVLHVPVALGQRRRRRRRSLLGERR